VFAAANIISALLFAAGHLPATIGIFGEVTPLILVRCFLLNGGFGLLFGAFFQRWGIHYAMAGRDMRFFM
jgi:membrane protease YdiL (CAAX protease family)